MISSQEVADLLAAQRGDQRLFIQLTERFRPELLAHCYRMLGSLQDAEDMVQETLLRAWKALPDYEARSAFRAWLYKIATNASLDLLDKRARRTLPGLSFPAADPAKPPVPAVEKILWMEPYPDQLISQVPSSPEARYSQKESVRLAFMVALQTLPPRQRAVLILRDVLGWRAKEVAADLSMTLSAANSALHRARRALHQRTLRQPEWQALEEEETGDLLERYVAAWEAADVKRLVALLKEDAAFAMPPSPSWYSGKEAIRIILEVNLFQGQQDRWRLLPTKANGLPAFGLYERAEEKGSYSPSGIQVIRPAGSKIQEVFTFLTPALFPFFELTGQLPPEAN